MANVKIDCTQIPRVQMDILCRTLLAGIERFYSEPENLRRYEAWLQKCREEGKFYDDDDTQTAAPAVQWAASYRPWPLCVGDSQKRR